MNGQEITDMPGIEAAMERFGSVEESTKPIQLDATTTPATREQQTPPALAAVKTDVQTSDSKPTDTRATAEQKPVAPVEPVDKSTDAAKPTETVKPDAKAEAEKSRYAKSQERLTKTWDQVNADKASIAADKARLETERAEFARKQAEFDAIRKQAEAPQYTPDDYAKAAQAKRQNADAMRMQAKRAEDAGRFDEAAKLTKQADKIEGQAEDMAEHAEALRKNPPASFQQRAKQYEEARKHYTIEAAKEWPDLAKDNSPFQVAVATELRELAKSDPALAAHPSVIYHASRLVHLEMREKALEADAARVPVLVKEAETLRAKIKELEMLTTPAGGGSVARFGADAPADDYNALRQAASENGSFFR